MYEGVKNEKADAFEAFEETSLFDRETADSFRKNILAAGGIEGPMTLYVKFRGAEPKVEPLLKSGVSFFITFLLPQIECCICRIPPPRGSLPV